MRFFDSQVGHILWNIVGLALPLVVAAASIPLLLGNIGAEKFGLIGLAWGMIGYASMLDLGVSRAVTQRLAIIRGTQEESCASSLLDSAAVVTVALSCVFLVAMTVLALCGVDRIVSIEGTTPEELRTATLLVAIALPFQALGMTYKGTNEAYLNFAGIAIIRLMLGIGNFAGPLLVSLWTVRLDAMVATLTVARVIAFVLYFILAKRCLGDRLLAWHGVSRRHVSELLQFGRWVAVSAVISPILVQADRFFIAVLISAGAVTHYVVPYELTAQTMIISGAVTTVFFPTVARIARTNHAAGRASLLRWAVLLGGAMIVGMSGLALLMPTVLGLWIGPDLSGEAVTVGRILCVGVIFNAVGSMFYAYLHALGRSKETAINHLVELPIHIIALYVLISAQGVIGAAIAWTLRVAIDMSLLCYQVYGKERR